MRVAYHCVLVLSVSMFFSHVESRRLTHPRRSTSGLRQTWLFFQTKGDRRWNLIFLKQNRVFQTWVAMLIIFTPDGFSEDLTRRWDTYIVLVAYWNNLAVFVWFRLVLGKTSPQQRNLIPSSAWLSLMNCMYWVNTRQDYDKKHLIFLFFSLFHRFVFRRCKKFRAQCCVTKALNASFSLIINIKHALLEYDHFDSVFSICINRTTLHLKFQKSQQRL